MPCANLDLNMLLNSIEIKIRITKLKLSTLATPLLKIALLEMWFLASIFMSSLGPLYPLLTLLSLLCFYLLTSNIRT